MSYVDEITAFRQRAEATLRAEDGWLTLTGLYWLSDGENSIGSAAVHPVQLPPSTPETLGTLHIREGRVTLRTLIPVLVDGQAMTEAEIRTAESPEGPNMIQLGTVTFFVIQRGSQLAVRVKDSQHPARFNFTGREWFPIDERYRFRAVFTPHPSPRELIVINSVGIDTPMENPGIVTFVLDGVPYTLQAFDAEPGSLWFIFKDGTNGHGTYGAGRFLVAPLIDVGTVDLDFNRAYSPPCAFTPYATCPLPPKENTLPIPIPAGEKDSGLHG